MATTIPRNAQYGRKVSLQLLKKPALVTENGQLTTGPSQNVTDAIDLSEMHFTFHTTQDDNESPATCSIRIYNLSDDIITQVKVEGEYSFIVLQAGYIDNFGIIFKGQIRQYKIGRESDMVTSYLDLLCADGDESYTFGVCLAPSLIGQKATTSDQITALNNAFDFSGGVKINPNTPAAVPVSGGVLPRGKVMYGMARTKLRSLCQSIGATWSIQDGKIQIIPLDGYLATEVVILNAATGLIGVPEQTIDGVIVRCLMNPKIAVGGLIQIDNASINQTMAKGAALLKNDQGEASGGQLPFNMRSSGNPPFYATVTADGLYRVYQAEYTGDTRGQEFYVDLIGLAVTPVTKKAPII
jgi:hypothetical protein